MNLEWGLCFEFNGRSSGGDPGGSASSARTHGILRLPLEYVALWNPTCLPAYPESANNERHYCCSLLTSQRFHRALKATTTRSDLIQQITRDELHCMLTLIT